VVYIILSSLRFRAAAVLRPSWSVRFQSRFDLQALSRHARKTPASARQNERSAQAASERTQGARQAGAAAHGSSAGMQTGIPQAQLSLAAVSYYARHRDGFAANFQANGYT